MGYSLYSDIYFLSQDLVNKLSGTGMAIIDENGDWTRKERVTNNKFVSVYFDENGNKIETKKAIQ